MAKGEQGSQEGEERMSFVNAMPVFAKELIAGGVAGGFAKTVVAPLERVKILFQELIKDFRLEEQNFTVRGCGDPSERFGRQKEYLVSTGNGASVARIVPYAALHYMAYEQYRRWIILSFPNINRGPILDLIAGSFAGGTAVICTYPLDLVRTKLAYQVVGPSSLSIKGTEIVYRGIFDCFSKIYRESGLRGLYRGVAPSLYGIFPYSGLKFYFYEEMKSHVPEEHNKDITVKLFCGSVAGLLGQTFTYPLDVVRRQMQVQRFSVSDSVEMKGTTETLFLIVQKQGWKQLFSGLSINYLKVVPSVAIGFTVYDTMKSRLGVPSRENTAIEVVTEGRNTHPSALRS